MNSPIDIFCDELAQEWQASNSGVSFEYYLVMRLLERQREAKELEDTLASLKPDLDFLAEIDVLVAKRHALREKNKMDYLTRADEIAIVEQDILDKCLKQRKNK